MPDRELIDRYERLRERHRRVVEDLVPVLEAMAVASIGDVLPGAHRLEVEGRINEDWIPVLRIHRVVDERGAVLFDVSEGNDDERIEETIDEVGVEYLDLLLDLTGDDYMGTREVEA
jgi:hypothetical protein